MYRSANCWDAQLEINLRATPRLPLAGRKFTRAALAAASIGLRATTLRVMRATIQRYATHANSDEDTEWVLVLKPSSASRAPETPNEL